MKIRNLTALLIIGIVTGACNRQDETPAETRLPIADDFLPNSVVFDRSDTDFLNTAKDWNHRYITVNSQDELPDDPLGFSESYTHVNFSEYSLLLTYRLHTWTIDTYRSTFVKNNVENTYDWTISVGSSDYGNENYDRLILTRFAIKVRKLPENAELRIWWSMTDMGFDWSE